MAIALVASPGARAEPDRNDGAEPDPVTDGEVIVVTGSLGEGPLKTSASRVDVIGREAIERSGATTVGELLEGRAGVDIVRSFRGAAPRIRGLGSEYVLVLVDGQRVIGRTAGAIDLDRLSTSDIERIEITRGASSAVHGSDAIGGVIHIRTRRPERAVEAEATARTGSLGRHLVDGRIGTDRGPIAAELRAGWRAGDAYDRDPSDLATSGSAFDQSTVAGRASLGDVDRRIEARAEYALRDERGIDTGAGGAIFDRHTRDESVAVGVDGRWQRTRATLQYSLHRHALLMDQRGSDELDRHEPSSEDLALARVVTETSPRRRHLVAVGVEGALERMESARLRGDGRRQRLALFAQDEWGRLAPPVITVVPGARVDLDSQYGAHVSPKLALRWDPGERWVVRASYGWGFRAPSFEELLLTFENPSAGYRVDGNPALEPERSRGADLSLEARLGEHLWAEASAYHQSIDDLIATDLDDSEAGVRRFTYRNIGSARVRGGELGLRLRADTGSVRLSYALTDTLDRDRDRPLPGRALHRATAGATLEVPRVPVELSAQARFEGARAFHAGDEMLTAEPYATADARARWRATDFLDLFIGVDNAVDAGDAELLPIPPRSFHAGATARH